MASPVFLLSENLVEDILEKRVPAFLVKAVADSAADDLRCWCRHQAIVGLDRMSIINVDRDHLVEIRLAYKLLMKLGAINHHTPDLFSIGST